MSVCKQVITAVGCHEVNYSLHHVALNKLFKLTTPGHLVSVLTIEFSTLHSHNKAESRRVLFYNKAESRRRDCASSQVLPSKYSAPS